MRPHPDCSFVVASSTLVVLLKEAALNMLAFFDEAAEDSVGNARHWRKHGCGGDLHVADGEACGDARVLRHGVLGGRVPAFLFEGVALLHQAQCLKQKASAYAGGPLG